MTVSLTISFQRYDSFSLIRNIICLGFHQLVKVCKYAACLAAYLQSSQYYHLAISIIILTFRPEPIIV